MKKVLIAGGGTGGHIAPALAVGKRISGEGWAEVFYARTERPVDAAMYAAEGDRAHTLRSPRIDRGARILLPFTGTLALFRAVGLLRRLKIEAVLGTGGYASFYCVAAAWLCGIPCAVLDTNAIPGRSNRLVSRFAKLAFAAFPGQEDLFHCAVKTAGIPVQTRKRPKGARPRLGLSDDHQVVLFLGGSQGARAVNDLAMACPPTVNVLLQCGESDEQRVKGIVADRGNFLVAGFLADLSDWYAAADIAVARAGAQTLAELSEFGVPTVFIPYPHAADDHQAANAMMAVRAGAALMKRQETLEPEAFWSELKVLLENRGSLEGMAQAMSGLLPKNAAQVVSEELRRLCG
ncbi:MAG: UDP-N-acetylglucosamine--N-acetylmuramyl-(pentapeptide) pyrophosphoryl-undecaprenol N-acetylglucosamine transferase [Candidatus Fermentibacteraceae bacterium]